MSKEEFVASKPGASEETTVVCKIDQPGSLLSCII